MKYGILWRTKGLAKLLVSKVELNLGKAVFTSILRKVKDPIEYRLIRQLIDHIDQAKDYTDYGINILTEKIICTDQLVSYNITSNIIAGKLNIILSEIKEYESNKEGA